MHGDSTLGGPVYWALMGVVFLAAALALFVLIDATRPKRAWAFAERPWMRWLWIAPQVVYLLLWVLQNIPATANSTMSLALVVLTPFALVTQTVYLLRVAYPSPRRLAASAPEAGPPGQGPELSVHRLPEEPSK